MTVCEQIGAWAAGVALADVPERALERARVQTDSILAGQRAGRRAAEPFRTVAPEGPLGAVYGDAAASIAHDWDDYLFMGHTGHSAVPVSRAFTDDPERALLAQVAANEVAGRVGAALFLGPHNGQFWSSIHCASGAVAAGVALGLDAERLAHALAISLYQPPYGLWPGFMGPDTKLLTAAEPAVQGARAALLAAEGVTGALDVIEDRRGLLANLAFVRRPAMLGELGRVWLTDTIAVKEHPGCAYLQTAVTGLLDSGVEAGEIASIDVDAGYLTVAMEELGRRGGITPVGVGFSTALSLAVVVLAGRLTHEELRPEWLLERSAELGDFASRVRVKHDWELTLRTLHGTVDAGASVRDVPLSAWPRVLRRARELGMDETALVRRDLGELLRRPELRREVRSLVSTPAAPGLAGLDTSALRMTFPSRLRIRLRSGRVVEADGVDRGATGSSPAEQRSVVERKQELVGAAESAAAG